jgi:hypothetical protein
MHLSKVYRALMLLAVAVLIVPVGAMAAITFDTTVTDIQQTQNSPCVIGDPSCNQPVNFGYFSVSGSPAGVGATYDFYSPTYIAGASGVTGNASGLDGIPTSFTVAIDSNIAAGQGEQSLVYFRTYLCTAPPGSTQTTGGNISSSGSIPAGCALDAANSYQPASPTVIPNANNGNGYSDVGLTGFNLVSGSRYLFEVRIANGTDGAEEFFISNPGTTTVPEPTPILLLGFALMGVAYCSRRLKPVRH